MKLNVVRGDLLDQDVECIVNAWNRNLFPWWLLIPQGVSAAIKRRGGLDPFRELRRFGLIPLGGAVLTGAGRLPYRGIIHVAGINLAWFATERSIRTSVRSAMSIASRERYSSVAMPLIGSGTGSRDPSRVQALMTDELSRIEFDGEVRIVVYAGGAA